MVTLPTTDQFNQNADDVMAELERAVAAVEPTPPPKTEKSVHPPLASIEYQELFKLARELDSTTDLSLGEIVNQYLTAREALVEQARQAKIAQIRQQIST